MNVKIDSWVLKSINLCNVKVVICLGGLGIPPDSELLNWELIPRTMYTMKPNVANIYYTMGYRKTCAKRLKNR
jgi:hypothetical protein